MKRLLLVLLLILAVACFATFTCFAPVRTDTLEVTGTSLFRGAVTLYTGVFCGAFTGDFDLDGFADIDATSDTLYAANILTSGRGGALYVESSNTTAGNVFAFAYNGEIQFSMPKGGGFVFADATKPVIRIILPLAVGGGTADVQSFSNSPSINLDTTDETFYASVPIPADWDGASDLTIYLMVGNEIAETDGDDVSITFTVHGYADGETMEATGQTVAVLQELTGDDEAINVVNQCTGTIDYNEGTYPIAVDDLMTIKGVVNLGTDTECTGPLHIVAWWIEYTADQLSQ